MKFFQIWSTWGCCSMHSSWHLPVQDFWQESRITLRRNSNTWRQNSRRLSAIWSGKMSQHLTARLPSTHEQVCLAFSWEVGLCCFQLYPEGVRWGVWTQYHLQDWIQHTGKVIHSCIDFEFSWLAFGSKSWRSWFVFSKTRVWRSMRDYWQADVSHWAWLGTPKKT